MRRPYAITKDSEGLTRVWLEPEGYEALQREQDRQNTSVLELVARDLGLKSLKKLVVVVKEGARRRATKEATSS